MTVRLRRLVIILICAIATTMALGAQQSAGGRARQTSTSAAHRPRLVVLFVVDQFPVEYIDWYASTWTHGLKRLLTDGAVFRNAAYPYANTVTCPGHNTIGTGVLPNVHGMISNTWYDRTQSKSIACTEDPSAEPIGFAGIKGSEHHSPKQLMASSFADRLREQQQADAHIVSLSLKPRSAIGMAGHAGPHTMVVWLEDNGVFATSTAYAKAPWPEVDAFVKQHPIARDFDQVWTRSLADASYKYDDDAPGEAPPAGWGRIFPHRIASTSDDKVAAARASALNWQHSPLSDAYLGAMAAALVDTVHLGRNEGTDMLAVSFSALDMVGHPYGPRSHEVQDVLVRLDETIGTLLDTLDRQVGRDNYVVAWSSDHGVALVPEQAVQMGMDAGRVSATQLRDAVEQTGRAFTAGPVVANISAPNIYLTPAAAAALGSNPAAKRVIASAIRGVPGVASAYWAEELASHAPTRDAALAASRRSYVAGRSGDLMFVTREHWITAATGTTHGSPYPYDRRVPLVFMGAGIKAGSYAAASGPMDIAPTLARLTGVRLTQTDGHPLTGAFGR